MFKKIILAAGTLLALSAPAIAQSGCPTIVYGAVLTAAQWNACFAAKNNTLGYAPVNKAGDSMSGKLTTVAPNGITVGLNLPLALSAPSAAVSGDIWTSASGLNMKINGNVVGPFNTGLYTGASAPSSPQTYSFWNNTAGATIPFDIYDGTSWVNIGTLDPTAHTWTFGGTIGGKTLILGANLTTTGVGATTLAFGASTQTYTFPTTTATLARTDAGQTFTGSNVFAGVSATGLTLSSITGSTQCLQVNSSGVVSGAGAACASVVIPKFNATLITTAQTVTSSTTTKVQLNSVNSFGGTSYWNAGTYVYTPPAGNYMACGQVYGGGGAVTGVVVNISKNGTVGGSGTSVSEGDVFLPSAVSNLSAGAMCQLVTMNGTDTLELDATIVGTSPQVNAARAATSLTVYGVP